jgi:hypothetical protein
MPLPIKQINLEKGMYQESKNKGQSFSELLEELDPSGNYSGDLAKLSAFQRQLALNGIETKGSNAALVQKFFDTNSSKVLFPEWINGQILVGMKMGRRTAQIDDIVAVINQIEGGTMRSIEMDLTNSDYTQKRIAQGGNFPVAKIKTKEKTIDLYKVGIEIDADYEAIRRVKVNVMAVFFQVLGMKLSRDIVYEALLAIINGDGNSNPAGIVNSATTGAVVFDDLLKLDFNFEDGFEPDTAIANNVGMKKVHGISEFRDPLIGSDFLTKGTSTSPFGYKLRTNRRLADNQIVAFNKALCIEMLEEKGSQLVETDKIIDKQIQKSVVSKYVGFSKIFSESAQVLTLVQA